MTELLGSGPIRKMISELKSPVTYTLPLGDAKVAMNPLVGKTVTMRFSGRILCVACGLETKKSFNQGYCFPCFRSLAESDLCIMRPETCHFHLGTCRDPAWAEDHCMQSHVVYIANSSGLKVGITRGSQIPTRWIDQGATQAVPVFRVKSRFHSGLIESALKKHVSDRTDWRRMLKGANPIEDLAASAKSIVETASADMEGLNDGQGVLQPVRLDESVVEIEYPVVDYPEKVRSLNFDKTPEVRGLLQGIKGQYLILDGGVINMRKFTGYEVELSI